MSWYYAKDGEQQGPHTEEEFHAIVHSGNVTADTMVWKEGMVDWRPWGEVSSGEDSPANDSEMVVCAISGNTVPRSNAIQLDGKWISAEHKEEAIQKLKTGGLTEVTGEMHYAGFWIRVAARFIDGIILAVVTMIIYFIGFIPIMGIGMSGGEEAAETMSGWMIALQLALQLIQWAIAIAYETWMIGKYQATLGKMAFGLKVVRPDGDKLTMQRAFGRYWGVVLSYITIGIGYIMVAFDDEKRGLHDRICDTRVIKVKK